MYMELNINIFRRKDETGTSGKGESQETMKKNAEKVILGTSRNEEPTEQDLNNLVQNLEIVCDPAKKHELKLSISQYLAIQSEFKTPIKQLVDGIIAIAKDKKYIDIERL